MPSSSNTPPAAITPLGLVAVGPDGQPLALRRKPGRPRKQVIPTVHEVELARAVNAEREAFVDQDGVVQAIESKTPTPDILKSLVLELAYETAAIRQEIRSAQAAAKSDGLPQKHSRRIDGLVKIAAITLEAHKIGLVEPDFRSEAAQRVYRLFMETIGDVADATLESPTAFKERCAEALSGWEDRVDAPIP